MLDLMAPQHSFYMCTWDQNSWAGEEKPQAGNRLKGQPWSPGQDVSQQRDWLGHESAKDVELVCRGLIAWYA